MNSSYTIVVCSMLIIVLIITLAIMGQPFSHKNKLPKLWYSPLNTDQSSQHILDWYSFTHISHGVLFYLLFTMLPFSSTWPFGEKLVAATILEIMWEIAENMEFIINKYRSYTISLGYSGDSITNSVADVLLCILGAFMASRLPLPYSIMFFVVSELILAWLIRDNLVLNVIMFIYPSESIKEWQMAAWYPNYIREPSDKQ